MSRCSGDRVRTGPGPPPSPARRPATSPCFWGRARTGPGPPPSPPLRPDRRPARTPWRRRPGLAVLRCPASPGRPPSRVPARPATPRCSSGPGRTGNTGLQRGGLPPPTGPGPGRPSPGRGRVRRPASCRCSPRRGRTLPAPAGSARTGRVRTGLGRSCPARTGPDWPSRTARAGPAGRSPGVPVRTTPDQVLAAAAARRTVPGPGAAGRTGPPTADRTRCDRRGRRTDRGLVALPRQSGSHRRGRRSATAARSVRSRVPGRPRGCSWARRSSARRWADPGLPIRPMPARSLRPVRPVRTTRRRARRHGPPGLVVAAADGRRRRPAARLPSGRNRHRDRGSPRPAGTAGASESRSGEPDARSTSWSPPPSGGPGWPPAVGGARWPDLGRPAAPARAVAAGGRPARTASGLPAWARGGSPGRRRAVPAEAIRAGTPAARRRAQDGCAAGRGACRPVAAGRWCGLGSRGRPGRRRCPEWGRAADRRLDSHRHRRLRRPSHARRGQTRRSDDSTGTSRPRACPPRTATSSPPPAGVAALASPSSVGRTALRGMADGQLA